jgi:hypothetical protein
MAGIGIVANASGAVAVRCFNGRAARLLVSLEMLRRNQARNSANWASMFAGPAADRQIRGFGRGGFGANRGVAAFVGSATAADGDARLQNDQPPIMDTTHPHASFN